MFALWFLSTVAGAHVPHDTVAALAFPADLAESGTWAVLVSAHLPLLSSRDERGFYQLVGGEPMGDAPVDAAQLPDGTVVILGGTELWWSPSLTTWEHAPLPGRVDQLVVDDEEVVLAGADGVWSGTPDDLAQVSGEPASYLSRGAAVAFVGPLGEVWRRDEGEWSALAAVPGTTAVLAGETDTFVGTAEGAVFRWDGGGWARCGELPDLPADHADVVVLASDPADATAVYAATGVDGPYRSTDSCSTFQKRFGTSGIQYDGEGSPANPHEAVTAVLANGDRLVVAGWMGLFHSEDAGRSWETSPLLPVDYLRGLSVVPGADGGTVILEGPYASGPLLSMDGGASWTAVNAGLAEDNVQQVVADPHDPARLYAVVGHLAYVSRDGGASWTATVPVQLGDFDPDESAPGVVWASGREGVVRSDDAGASWAPVPGLPATGHFVGRVAWGGYADCLATSGPTEVWCDDAGEWALMFASEEHAWGLGVSGAALVLGVESGVLEFVTDAPEQKLGPLVADQLISLAVTDDGTAFAGTESGLVYRRFADGERWEALPFRTPAPVWTLAPLPDFTHRGALLLGTLDGAYMVERDAEAAAAQSTLSRWAPEQWVDDASHYLVRAGCPESDRAVGYGLDTRTSVTPGCSLTTTVRGSHLRLRGTSAGTAHADVLVDGERVAAFGGREVSAPGTLVEVETTAGWHQVAIVGVGGEGLFVDSLEANDGASGVIGPGNTGDVPGPDCGCGAGRAPAGAALVALTILAGRRRAGRAPTTGAT